MIITGGLKLYQVLIFILVLPVLPFEDAQTFKYIEMEWIRWNLVNKQVKQNPWETIFGLPAT
jgi:hypothetical protein